MRAMMMTRRDWLKGLVATIGLDAVGGGRFLFAAPPGWTAPGGAKLVLGVFSDTHLRTDWTGLNAARTFPHDYLNAALAHFRAANVDAVVHCGDMAHRGQVRELEFHAEAWRRFFPDNRAPDGHTVEKLFVTGNHETDGWRYGTDDGFKVEKAFPDPAERDRRILAVDLAAKWEKVWGEKYEKVWHKEIKGYHFFGRHHGVGEKLAGGAGRVVAREIPGDGVHPQGADVGHALEPEFLELAGEVFALGVVFRPVGGHFNAVNVRHGVSFRSSNEGLSSPYFRRNGGGVNKPGARARRKRFDEVGS